MSCEDYTKFNNIESLNDHQLINQLEENVKTFLDWGFLNIGGFINDGGNPANQFISLIGQEILGFTEFEGRILFRIQCIPFIHTHGGAPVFIALVQLVLKFYETA